MLSRLVTLFAIAGLACWLALATGPTEAAGVVAQPGTEAVEQAPAPGVFRVIDTEECREYSSYVLKCRTIRTVWSDGTLIMGPYVSGWYFKQKYPSARGLAPGAGLVA